MATRPECHTIPAVKHRACSGCDKVTRIYFSLISSVTVRGVSRQTSHLTLSLCFLREKKGWMEGDEIRARPLAASSTSSRLHFLAEFLPGRCIAVRYSCNSSRIRSRYQDGGDCRDRHSFPCHRLRSATPFRRIFVWQLIDMRWLPEEMCFFVTHIWLMIERVDPFSANSRILLV